MKHKISFAATAVAAAALGAGGVLAAAGTGLKVTPSAANAQTAAVSQVTCSGSSADSATLSSAISALPEGGTLLVEGTCDLTQPLVLAAGRTYQGTTGDGSNDGVGTVLAQHFTGNHVVANDAYASKQASAGTGDPLTVQDLAIACDSSATNGLVLMAWQVIVSHVDVAGCDSGIVDTSTDAAGTAIPASYTYLGVSQNSSGCSGSLTVNGNVICDQTAGNKATGMNFQGNGTSASLVIGSAGNVISGVATTRTTSGTDVSIGGE